MSIPLIALHPLIIWWVLLGWGRQLNHPLHTICTVFWSSSVPQVNTAITKHPWINALFFPQRSAATHTLSCCDHSQSHNRVLQPLIYKFFYFKREILTWMFQDVVYIYFFFNYSWVAHHIATNKAQICGKCCVFSLYCCHWYTADEQNNIESGKISSF